MSELSATVEWFSSSLTFGHCAVCGSTPQKHIFSLSVTRAGLCGRCGLRVIATGSQEEEICPLSLGFFFSRSLAAACSGLLTLSVVFFLSGSL